MTAERAEQSGRSTDSDSGDSPLWDDTRSLADLLDTRFRVPGTQWRFGIDGLMGLIPGAGDLAGLVLASMVILQGVHLGARGWTVARMILNATIDAVVGAVPVLGWFFDFGFKANQRNLALIERHLSDPAATDQASRRAVLLTVVGLAVVVVAVLAAVAALILWILSAVF